MLRIHTHATHSPQQRHTTKKEQELSKIFILFPSPFLVWAKSLEQALGQSETSAVSCTIAVKKAKTHAAGVGVVVDKVI